MDEKHRGKIDLTDPRPAVRFERVFRQRASEVWKMISTAEGLERWLAPAEVDLQLGGLVDIDFGDGGVVGGEILQLVPGELLEYVWRFVGEPDSIVRFELERTDAGTRLVLTHTLLPGDQAAGYGAGWHAHLDQLDHVLAGGDHFDWGARFEELLPAYANQDRVE